ncbi:cyclic nucleotide-binding domain-containing protein [Roseibacterium sp. SDUM158016]|uniref:cyclic nucleotide-binding domain-containing protein n=1 Tax=Roseicyclus sediminis TaxID=2980997 RepID=UPI0021D01ABF|nr:cyclic nucleotide-binding domain-containing protein [Roseibacterium sp. SDUM158016]MCU4651838.1 cyclic nucleotide-binding domain-containing protein [Roseibacterium sp. SDUM158016]
MELTLASALSTEGLLGHLAYVVLVASMLMRSLTWLRILVIVSALLAISYGWFIIRDPVTVIWETMLVLVNVIQLAITHWRNIRARFSDDEMGLLSRHFPGLTRGEARGLFDAGEWSDLAAGGILATEGAAVDHLSYLAHGSASVEVGGVRVSLCGEGDFIGEMTALTGLPATATVRADGACRVWRIEAGRLREIVRRRDALEREVDAAFARNYREKLLQMNALVAAGRVPS